MRNAYGNLIFPIKNSKINPAEDIIKLREDSDSNYSFDKIET